MSRIIVPGNIDHLPFLDKEFIFIAPPLTPENFHKINPAHRDLLRLGWFTNGDSTGAPRFSTEDFFYKISIPQSLHTLPNLTQQTTLSFSETTDLRSAELSLRLANVETLYLFWSGGIDSNVILCSMIKNWDTAALAKVTIVLNQHSIAEDPVMYNKFIRGKMNEINTDQFYSGIVVMNNSSLYVSGTVGDVIMGPDMSLYDSMYPNSYHSNWVTNIDNIISYFSIKDGKTKGVYAFETVRDSITKLAPNVESVYDFMTWIRFNWGYFPRLYDIAWVFSTLPPTCNVKDFLENNQFVFFNSITYQNWTVATMGSTVRLGSDPVSHKRVAKDYIYDVTHDSDYFINKRKEKSVTKIKQFHQMKQLVGIDTSYTLYYQDTNITPWESMR